MSLRPIRDAWIPLLARAADHWHERTGLGIPDRNCLARLVPLLDRVATWTARVDLTAARDAEALVEIYLTDALGVAALLPDACGPVLDVGSGGGAPGLCVALLRPDIMMTLLEPRAKRIAFLRTTVAELGCDQVEVRRGRSEELGPCEFQVALSRATFAPEQWLAEGARLASQRVWVFLATANPPTLGGWWIEHDIAYCLPFSDAPRRAVCFARSDAT